MRKRSYVGWITTTDNQKTDEKRDRHPQGRELRAGTGGRAEFQRMK